MIFRVLQNAIKCKLNFVSYTALSVFILFYLNGKYIHNFLTINYLFN